MDASDDLLEQSGNTIADRLLNDRRGFRNVDILLSYMADHAHLPYFLAVRILASDRSTDRLAATADAGPGFGHIFGMTPSASLWQ